MDSKYENLPGIARDEPDVYETREQPQVEQPVFEDDSENVQKINISQKDAFEAFNKSDGLNNRFTDFSDAINNRHKIGYLLERDSYEYDQFRESLSDRFDRLQKDLHDLRNEIKQAENGEVQSDGEKGSKLEEAKSLSKQLDSITKEVSNLHLEIVGAKFDASKLDVQVKKQLLMDYLNDSKKTLVRNEQTKVPSAQKPNESAASPSDGSITFKLFSDLQNDSSLNKLAKVSDIDQRISKLEAVIGTSQQNKVLATLCASIDNKTLLGLVEHLENKTNLVDQQSLDLIESKLNWILQKAQQLNEKKTLIEDNEKMTKISELYQITSKWKDVLSTLPNITARLTSLNDLHQQAFQFSSALTRLDCEQQTMRQTLDSNNSILKQLNQKLNENVDSINKSLDNLNSRIATIN